MRPRPISRTSRPRGDAPGATRPLRPRALALGAAAALALAACGDEDPQDTGIDVGDEVPDADDDTEHDAAEPDDPDPDDGEDGADEPATTGEGDDEGVPPLEGEPDTEHVSLEAEGHGLTVVDVRVSAHDGFDRLVFELDGDEAIGYEIGWTEDGEATAQGSGHPIEVAGDEALHIALHGIALPYDADEGVERFDEEHVEGGQGVIHELVSDTIYEGIQTFVAGADERHAFLVQRLEDPQRVVVDVHHDTA